MCVVDCLLNTCTPSTAEDIVQLKKKFGFDPDQKYVVPDDVYKYYHKLADENNKRAQEWEQLLDKYCQKFSKEGADLKRRLSGKLPDGWQKHLPKYTPADKPIATRKLSEAVITALADVIPELIGGSADLTGSNNTRWKTAVDFQPVRRITTC